MKKAYKAKQPVAEGQGAEIPDMKMDIVRMSEAEKTVGKVVVLWRKDKRQAVRVLEVDKPTCCIAFEVLAGEGKGECFACGYDDSRSIYIYEDEKPLIALLETDPHPTESVTIALHRDSRGRLLSIGDKRENTLLSVAVGALQACAITNPPAAWMKQ